MGLERVLFWPCMLSTQMALPQIAIVRKAVDTKIQDTQGNPPFK
jgi:hypothetical protein